AIIRLNYRVKTLNVILVASLFGAQASAAEPEARCTIAPAPSTLFAANLDRATRASRQGVAYDASGAALHLDRAGGSLRRAPLGVAQPLAMGCAADFDGDGWTDLVASAPGSAALTLLKNRTSETPIPDWNDPTQARAPRFEAVAPIESSSRASG